jgi:hypothetical protein
VLVPVKPDEEVIAARLLEFLAAATPWHRRLWNTSLLLGLREVLEAAEAARASVLSEESVKATASTCVRLAGLDPGLGGEQAVRTLQHALTGRLRYDGLDYHTVSHIAEDLESHYLQRWADAIRGANPPKLERTARSIAAHLLDLGFGPNYLHRWWTYKIAHEATAYSLADVVEQAHTLARRPIQAFQVLLAFQSSPRSRAGYPPDWLTPGQVSAWLAANNFAPAGPGIKGGLIRAIEARDPDTAAELAGEFIDNLTARASVGTGDDIDATQHVWVAGERGPTQLKRRLRGVRVRALYREGQIIPTPNQHSILDPVIEMLSHLERSSPSAAVAGGWAAIEALLSEPNDRGGAAERLASLVACSFPRAELTVLSYLLQRSEPSLAADLANCAENRDRSLVVARAIRAGQQLTLPNLSEKAALSRMVKLLASPRKTLEDLRTHITDSFTRLYRQRNLVLHWAKTDGVALRSTLRTTAPLVGAGMDRIAHAWYVDNLRPIELAARARVALATVSDTNIESCIDLLA